MKKRVLLALVAALMLALSSASAENALPDVQAGAPLYSNLGDESSLSAVAAAMKSGGLNAEAVDAVCGWVRDYNRDQAENPAYAIVSGFQPVREGAVNYGDAETWAEFNWQRWKRAKRNYYDALCRSTAYFLLRDQIDVATRLPEDQWARDGLLASDFDAFWGPEADESVDANPDLSALSEDEIAAYATLFAPIPDGGEDTRAEIAASMNRAFEARGVRFPQGGAGLMMVCYAYPGDGQIGVRHAAVCIKLDAGCLLFEKYGPDYPYQATLFATAAEAGAYLREAVVADCARYGSDAPEVIAVLLNGQLI